MAEQQELARFRAKFPGTCTYCTRSFRKNALIVKTADKGYAHATCFDKPGGPSPDEERISRAAKVLEERRAAIAGNRSVEEVPLKTRLRWRLSRLWWR